MIEICESFRSELGGCYDAYDQSIANEVDRLRSCGLQLLVYFDGPEQRFKEHTASKRDKQREEQWAKFFDFCEEGAKNTAGDSFPLPPLCKRQLLASLKNCGVAVHNCQGEADHEIAQFVSQSNAPYKVGEERFFAYGRDSDYMAMRGCPYVEFGTIVVSSASPQVLASTEAIRMRSSPTKASLLRQQPLHTAQARVWRRSEVCEALSVSEAQFVDWAVWVGNDYTSGYDRSGDFNIDASSNSSSSSGDSKHHHHSEGFSTGALDALLAAVVAAEGVPLQAQEAKPTGE